MPQSCLAGRRSTQERVRLTLGFGLAPFGLCRRAPFLWPALGPLLQIQPPRLCALVAFWLVRLEPGIDCFPRWVGVFGTSSLYLPTVRIRFKLNPKRTVAEIIISTCMPRITPRQSNLMLQSNTKYRNYHIIIVPRSQFKGHSTFLCNVQ